MGSFMAKMRLRCKQKLERYVRWKRRLGKKFMGLVVVGVYGGTEGFRASLMKTVLFESLNCPIFEEVLGGVGAIVNLGDVLDCLLLDL